MFNIAVNDVVGVVGVGIVAAAAAAKYSVASFFSRPLDTAFNEAFNTDVEVFDFNREERNEDPKLYAPKVVREENYSNSFGDVSDIVFKQHLAEEPQSLFADSEYAPKELNGDVTIIQVKVNPKKSFITANTIVNLVYGLAMASGLAIGAFALYRSGWTPKDISNINFRAHLNALIDKVSNIGK